MAWVRDIESKLGDGRIQPTEVIAHLKIFETQEGTKILQLDTYGSSERAMPGKQSQTLQFGEESAFKLFKALQKTYDFKA